MDTSRRRYLRAAGVAALGAVGGMAGCLGGGSGGDGSTVTAGPGGALRFDPESVSVGVGETVTWEFASAGHNVSAFPAHSDRVRLPAGAEPFGSMGAGGDKFLTVARGETFEHTFETAGTYTYVCVPHVSANMVGEVEVG